MTSIPKWPDITGPRVLTLVGNNITIDVRARKTASSLARAGYSVIALGVDHTGEAAPREELDGALIVRLTPTPDPRISVRSIRITRPELRDSLRFRLEMRRQRLQVRRRSFTAMRHWKSLEEPVWVARVGEAISIVMRRLGVSKQQRDRIRSGLDRRLRKIDKIIRFGPRRVRLKAEQRVTQLLNILYKMLMRSSKRVRRPGKWRKDLPELHRYEATMGSLVDALQPDLIHVHDVFHIGLAARAKARAQHDGRDIQVVYDAHEYVPGLPLDPVLRTAYADLEDEYIHRVDAVVTVSDHMAQAIAERHAINPTVVMNAPDMETLVEVDSLRSVCGIPENVPLTVYVGGIAPHRGAELMIDALVSLDGVHLALVVGPITPYIQSLLDRAKDLGLADRLHTAPFVAPEAVVNHIRSADVSIIPLSRDVLNYEVTLPNKLFQSIQAGVPVVVSDNPAMSEFVRDQGIGEVFEGGNPESLASALRKVLENPEIYTVAIESPELIERSSWSTQIKHLMEVHDKLGIAPHE